MAVPLLLLAACWLAVAAAALAAAIVAHEAAHALLAWSFGLTARMHAGERRTQWDDSHTHAVCSMPAILTDDAASAGTVTCALSWPPSCCQTGPAAILRVLDPRPPSRATWSRLPHVRVSAAAGGSQPAAAALRWARHAGWWASAALCASTVAAHSAWAATAPPPLQAALHAAVCMTGVVLACSLPTDLCGASAGCGATCFCGNLGLLLASATGATGTLARAPLASRLQA